MPRIFIDTQKVMALSSEIQSFRADYDTNMINIKTCVNGMSSLWNSPARSTAVSAFNTGSDGLRADADSLLNSYTQYLNDIVALGYTATEDANMENNSIVFSGHSLGGRNAGRLAELI